MENKKLAEKNVIQPLEPLVFSEYSILTEYSLMMLLLHDRVSIDGYRPNV